MDNEFWDKADDTIRITRSEANSPHVDSLLKRQMSLRGELGIARSYKRRWYYQNWFVFMIAGVIAATAAWAIIEPYFNDMHYFQGSIEDIDISQPMPSRFESGNTYVELNCSGTGYVVIKGQKIWLVDTAKEWPSDGSKELLDRSRLRRGDEIGVYLNYLDFGSIQVAVCSFVQFLPPPQKASRASLTLSQLNAQGTASALLLFPLVAGLIGLAIGSIDGVVCRIARRAVLCGLVGLLVGFVGGFLFGRIADLVYAPLSALAMKQMGDMTESLNPFGFFVQVTGRGVAWCFAGMAMGLGQGIAMRSKRLLLYGFLGGIIGGLVGGLLFDPVDFLLLGVDKPSAHVSRLIGFIVIGAFVGGMIGVVELLARDSWLQMTKGPLAGKEFLIFKDSMNIGSSSRNDIYLFNDDRVSDLHATIRSSSDTCQIQNHNADDPVLLNDRPIRTSRLRNGDRITIGKTEFIFQTRKQ